MSSDRRGRRVTIVGAGFGGLFAAREFERLLPLARGLEVTILDRHNYHLFTPLLYQVGSGGIEPGNICFPMRAMFAGGASIQPIVFHECEVLGIDCQARKVTTTRCDTEYDYLIFAPGSVTNYYGIPGIDKTTMPLKNIRDGIYMHRRILESFETALLEQDPQRRRQLLTFVFVGGGATGVETASTAAILVFRTLKRDFPGLVPLARVVLMEAGPSLLRGMNPEMGKKAAERLASQGVELLVGHQVASVDENGVRTKDGQFIASTSVAWVAGVRPEPLVERIDSEKEKDGRVIVNEFLEAKDLPGVYVIGDCASRRQFGDAKPYPPTAQVAMRQGKAVAYNIVAAMTGRAPQAFNYKYKGELVFLGRNHAVGEIGERVIEGFPAFVMYETYYMNKLAGFRKKVSTAIDWAYDYFYRRNTAKIE